MSSFLLSFGKFVTIFSYRLAVLGLHFKDSDKVYKMQPLLQVTKQILQVEQDIQVILMLRMLLIKNHHLVNSSGEWGIFKPLLIKCHPQSLPKYIFTRCTANYQRRKMDQVNPSCKHTALSSLFFSEVILPTFL